MERRAGESSSYNGVAAVDKVEAAWGRRAGVDGNGPGLCEETSGGGRVEHRGGGFTSLRRSGARVQEWTRRACDCVPACLWQFATLPCVLMSRRHLAPFGQAVALDRCHFRLRSGGPLPFFSCLLSVPGAVTAQPHCTSSHVSCVVRVRQAPQQNQPAGEMLQ